MGFQINNVLKKTRYRVRKYVPGFVEGAELPIVEIEVSSQAELLEIPFIKQIGFDSFSHSLKLTQWVIEDYPTGELIIIGKFYNLHIKEEESWVVAFATAEASLMWNDCRYTNNGFIDGV